MFLDGADFVFPGEWENDLYHGHGSLSQASGDTYTGTFRNGERHGHGVHTNAATGEMVGCDCSLSFFF
jgi:hypothetical protein